MRPAGGGEDERFRDAVILPGPRERPHPPRVRGDGRLRRRAAVLALDRRPHPPQGHAGRGRPARPGPGRSGGLPGRRRSRRSRTAATPARSHGRRARPACARSSTWRASASGRGSRRRIEAALDALPVSELVTAGVSPHAPFTVTHDDYAMLVGLARRRGLPVATHLLESTRETEHLDAFRDVLGPDTVAIHAVLADEADIALLAELDVPVAHCPRSNALLGCGIAPLTELLAAGVRVGLGTDSPSSAIDFDMWAEMRTAIMLQRARTARADALSAQTALELATTRAAGGDRARRPGRLADTREGRRPDRARPGRLAVPAVGRPGHRRRLRRRPRAGRTVGRCRRDTLQTWRADTSDRLRRPGKDDPGPERLITRALRTHPPHPEAGLHLPRRHVRPGLRRPRRRPGRRAASTSATCSARAARAAARRSRACSPRCSRTPRTRARGCGSRAPTRRTARRTRRSRRSRPTSASSRTTRAP